MQTQKRILNSQILLELICHVAFAVLMAYLVLTGKYQSYVTPRMVPYFYFTVAVMILWALTGLFRLFQPQHKTRAAHCLVLAVPIILLLLPHTAINTADLSSRFVSMNTFSGTPGQKSAAVTQPAGPVPGIIPSASPEDALDADTDVAEINITTSSAPADSTAAVPAQEPAAAGDTSAAQADQQAGIQTPPPDDDTSDLAGLDEENKKITVSDDNYGPWLYELYQNMDKYIGYQISIKGFVFKDPQVMKSNEFVPARLMMSCCVADLSPCGLLCQYDKAASLNADTWVTVEGVLHKAKFTYDDQTFDDIQITAAKVTPAEKVDGYIYPNY